MSRSTTAHQPIMLLALDVHYDHDRAIAAAVAFDDWTAAAATRCYISHVDGVADYASGAFYRRELPCLLQLLNEHALTPTHLVIDGYVDLDTSGRPGLGRHLFDALAGQVAIVGVAKTAFAGIGAESAILRGGSARPLYVTAAGVDLAWAKARIVSMNGPHRIPTLLKRADQLCRSFCG
jgi:deoxyribonuclease V